MFKKVWGDYKVLLRSIPASTVTLFIVSVIMMNLLANKELISLPWLALDCGFAVSWVSFLCMDMICKRFGAWYVVLGSSCAMLTSSVVNSLLNQAIGRLEHKNTFGAFALRSYVSTGIAQFVDNLVFAVIVSHTFFGWTWLQVLTCSLTGAVAELLCEVFLSPVGYRVVRGWERENVGALYLQRRAAETGAGAEAAKAQ